MACMFTFSKDGRQRLAGVLRALLIAQLVVSLVMVIYCYNVSIRVMSLLKDIHRVTVYLLYGLILCQAYCMKLHYTSGLRLLTCLLHYPYWLRATTVSRLWLISGALVAANGLLVHAACRSTLKALIQELSSSLRIGMSQYLTEPSWKHILDTMQVELECCGADHPSDWHEIAWINIDYLNENSEVVMKLCNAAGRAAGPLWPYSCCSPHVLPPCAHDPLQQWDRREVWGAGEQWSRLSGRGCVEAVRAPLARATLALQAFSLLVVLLQGVLTVVTALLRGSARDAALRGACSGPGRARLATRYHGRRANSSSITD